MAAHRPADLFVQHRLAEEVRRTAALVDGRPYFSYVDEVKQLRAAGDHDVAAGLLLRLIEAIEREATTPIASCPGVPPWYFEQLADIYRTCDLAERAGPLMQRYAILDVKAQTAGELLRRRMAAAGLGVTARSSTPSRRPPSNDGHFIGLAIGRAVGRILRRLKR